jgi:hypothetical protein
MNTETFVGEFHLPEIAANLDPQWGVCMYMNKLVSMVAAHRISGNTELFSYPILSPNGGITEFRIKLGKQPGWVSVSLIG